MAPRLSIVVPVLNSHEIVRRQVLHWNAMPRLPGVELIYVDDGSDPPIVDGVFDGLWDRSSLSDVPDAFYGRSLDEWSLRWPVDDRGPDRLRILQTGDTRPWTWALARNAGARIARGDYLLMCDLDYVIPRAAIESALAFTGDKLRFRREFGVLDEHGEFTQDHETLIQYGLPRERIAAKGTTMPPHPNNFCIRRELFLQFGTKYPYGHGIESSGGYPENLIYKPYPQGEDRWFKRLWMRLVESGEVAEDDADRRPTLFMFPNGQFCGDVDANPFGLFHDLSRKNDFNPAHLKLIRSVT